MWEEVWPGRLKGRWVAATQSACTGRARLKTVGGQGMRGAHVEHVAHGRDLGRVEAERLVERERFLPSRKAGMRRGKRWHVLSWWLYGRYISRPPLLQKNK